MKGGVQSSIFAPLLFLIHFINLCENLASNLKLFLDDTSLFCIVKDSNNLAAINVNNDSGKIIYWTFQWKISFNLDPCKQVQQVIFSRKFQKSVQHPFPLNNSTVNRTVTQKYLRLPLNSKLKSFTKYLRQSLVFM